MTSRGAWLVVIAVLGLLFVGGLIVLGLALRLAGDGDLPSLGGGRVAVVRLLGPIVESRGMVRELDECRRGGAIKAVVVRIDSPGGGIAPSQEILQAMRRLADEKPVVVSMGNVAASGGYYVAMGADSIVANPGSLTGSIGVIFSFLTAEELMKKVGVELQVFKSGANKDVGSYHRSPTPEERALLEGVIADAWEQFVQEVMDGREMTREQVVALADGRVFTGRQALNAGLIDALGTERDAVLMAARMAGIDGEPEVEDHWRRVPRWLELLEESSTSILPALRNPGLEYRLP